MSDFVSTADWHALQERIAELEAAHAELVEALRECCSPFVIGDLDTLISFEELAREFNRRQQRARAVLAKVGK